MDKDRTIRSKKKQKIDAIEPSDKRLTSLRLSWFDHLKRRELCGVAVMPENWS